MTNPLWFMLAVLLALIAASWADVRHQREKLEGRRFICEPAPEPGRYRCREIIQPPPKGTT